jgi:protein-tyrosine phosphatase
LPKFFAPQLRIVFGDFLAKRGPVLYHCSAGQDRTGVTSAIILAALGVPRSTIISDYHLSTALRNPKYEMPKITPAMAESSPVAKFFAGFQNNASAEKATPLKTKDGRAFLEAALGAIDAQWGSVDRYLQAEIGLSHADLQHLRKTYTE